MGNFRKKKKRSRVSDPFDTLGGAAIGIGGLGLTIGIGSGIASRAAGTVPGTPNVSGGFSTLAGFVPIATTVVAGGAVLRATRGLHRKNLNKRRSFF